MPRGMRHKPEIVTYVKRLVKLEGITCSEAAKRVEAEYGVKLSQSTAWNMANRSKVRAARKKYYKRKKYERADREQYKSYVGVNIQKHHIDRLLAGEPVELQSNGARVRVVPILACCKKMANWMKLSTYKIVKQSVVYCPFCGVHAEDKRG